jgi:hypothetical protein
VEEEKVVEEVKYNVMSVAKLPWKVKTNCPHCNKEIEVVIAGIALLPSNSEVVRFDMQWIEYP